MLAGIRVVPHCKDAFLESQNTLLFSKIHVWLYTLLQSQGNWQFEYSVYQSKEIGRLDHNKMAYCPLFYTEQHYWILSQSNPRGWSHCWVISSLFLVQKGIMKSWSTHRLFSLYCNCHLYFCRDFFSPPFLPQKRQRVAGFWHFKNNFSGVCFQGDLYFFNNI